MSPQLSKATATRLSNPYLVGAWEWVGRGFPVLRLVPGDKVPYAGSGGLKDATLDLATIERWWTEHPDANIGVRMDGHLTVDEDTDVPGLRETLRLWRDNGWSLPPTLWQLTGDYGGHRGCHAIYKLPEGVEFNTKPWPGVDLKYGAGAYIVGAPSRHPSGVNYELVTRWPFNEAVADPPEWLVKEARKLRSPNGNGDKPLAEQVAEGVAEGGRDETGYKYACRLRGLGLRIEEALVLQRAAWERMRLGDHPFPWEKAEVQVQRAYAEHESEFEKEVEKQVRWLQVKREAQRRVEAEEVGSDPDAEWAPTDLAETLEGEAVLPERFGLTKALYRGKVHWLQGEPESGKSVLAYGEAAHLIAQGETVVVFDEEAGQADVADKLRALGASVQDVRERLVYFDPEGRDLLRHAGRVRRLVTERRPALVVLDSAGAFLALSGLGENDNSEVTRFIVRVLLPLAHDLGAAVVGIDHLTKKDTEGRYARGAGDKLAKVDVAYRVSAPEPFSRQSCGVVMLECTKDRAGVIGRGTACRVQVVTGNSRIELLPVWVTKEEARQIRARFRSGETPEERIVLALTAAGEAMTTTQLAEVADRDRTTTSRLLNDLLKRGEVTSEPSGKGSEKQWRIVLTQPTL